MDESERKVQNYNYCNSFIKRQQSQWAKTVPYLCLEEAEARRGPNAHE